MNTHTTTACDDVSSQSVTPLATLVVELTKAQRKHLGIRHGVNLSELSTDGKLSLAELLSGSKDPSPQEEGPMVSRDIRGDGEEEEDADGVGRVDVEGPQLPDNGEDGKVRFRSRRARQPKGATLVPATRFSTKRGRTNNRKEEEEGGPEGVGADEDQAGRKAKQPPKM